MQLRRLAFFLFAVFALLRGLLCADTIPISWGLNDQYQLGDGTTYQRNTAIKNLALITATAGKTITSISVGLNHTLALTSDGKVYAWGDNTYGQLGDGTFVAHSTPTLVGGSLANKTVTGIAAGDGYSAAITGEGYLLTWGSFTHREYSMLTTPTSQTSYVSDGMITAISAGTSHILMLSSGGKVYSLGVGSQGQCGNLYEDDVSMIHYVEAVFASSAESGLYGKTVVAIAAGGDFSMALSSDGKVYAWGVGAMPTISDSTQRDRLIEIPFEVNRGSNTSSLYGKTVTAIAAGRHHLMALASDGTLHAWGVGANGQLGIGGTGIDASSLPLQVDTSSTLSALRGKTISSIATGPNQGLVLDSTGKLYTWGENSCGQLANGSTTSSFLPVAADATSAGSALTGQMLKYLSTGPTQPSNFALSDTVAGAPVVNSVAVPSAGTYKAFATLDFTVNFSAAVTVTGTPRIPLTVGTSTSYATYVSGSGTTSLVFRYTVQVWDYDSDGIVIPNPIDLNGGSIKSSSNLPASQTLNNIGSTSALLIDGRPPRVVSLTLTNAVAIVTPGSTLTWQLTCTDSVSGGLSSDFTVSGTGAGYVSAVSGSGTTRLVTVTTTQVGILSLNVNTSTSLQDSHGTGLYGGYTLSDSARVARPGQLACWGTSSVGQLGLGGNDMAFYATLVDNSSAQSALVGKNLVQVSTGLRHTLALGDDGTVYSFGDNTYGQLGVNDTSTTHYNYAQKVSQANGVSALYGKKIIAVAAGATHSLALGSDGTVYAWGSNSYGEVGDRSLTTRPAPVSTYVGSIITGKRIIAIAAGLNFSVALDGDGLVYAWGDSSLGQTGYGVESQSWVPSAVSTGITSSLYGRKVAAIAAAKSYALALATDGTVHAWGMDSSGQLGCGTSMSNLPKQVNAGSTSALYGKTVVAIAAGDNVALALSSDGSLATWGLGSNLGNNVSSAPNASTPVGVFVAGSVSALYGKVPKAIACGVNHCVVLTTDGTLASWGLNSALQLGNPNYENASVLPIPVYAGSTSALYGATILGINTGSSNLGFVIETASVSPTTAPVVTGVSFPYGGYYGVGANLDVTVTYDKAVKVDTSAGTPYYNTSQGSSTLRFTYLSGSGTTALRFRHVVQSGENAPSGIQSFDSALTLNGGTIVDNSNALSAGSSWAFYPDNNASAGRTVIIDTVAPVITDSVSALSISYGVATTQLAIRSTDSSPAFYSATGLPTGLSLSDINGFISGTPTQVGVFTVAVRVTDVAGNMASKTITLTVTKASQTIVFDAIPDKVVGDAAVQLSASASSGLPVSFAIVSGPATVSGSQLTLSGTGGTVVVRASQDGNAYYSAAATVDRSFVVNTRTPVITWQPVSVSGVLGGSAYFSVLASSTGTLSYQWRKDGTVLAGATDSTLVLSNLSAADAGTYDVVVSNGYGYVTSAAAVLTVQNKDVAPVITAQPVSLNLHSGASASFSVTATGSPTPTYQWLRDGNVISGATSSTYSIASVSSSQQGSYSVVVSNRAGSVTSSSATLVVSQVVTGDAFFSDAAGSTVTNAAAVNHLGFVITSPGKGSLLLYLGDGTVLARSGLSLDSSGSFSFSSSVTDQSLVSADVAVTGFVATDGSLSCSVSKGGVVTASFVAQRSTRGASVALEGLYEANLSGTDGVLYTLAGPNGEALLVLKSSSSSTVAFGALATDGTLNGTMSSGQSITGKLSSDSTVQVTVSSAASQSSQVYAGGSGDSLLQQRFVNISSRCRSGTGNSVSIAGLVVSGSEAKTILLRAVGPGLSKMGVSGVLAKPQIQLYSGSTVIASNTGWSTSADATKIASAASLVGAFALDSGSADSALLVTLAPGAYTAIVSGADGSSGVMLVEAYDVSGSPTTQRLVNISTRADVGLGDNVCIAGFVISGSTPKRLLIRGVGPSLTSQGVSGVLAHPQIVLYKGSTAVAQNSGWASSANSADIATAASSVGAFKLSSNDDAALLLSLDPGVYTVILSGVNSTTGIGLVEVYELP